MSAARELESYAVKYASEAINFDKQGSKSLAISKYQRAVEVLLKLCSLYPKAPQNQVYMDRAESYRRRIQELKGEITVAQTSDSSPEVKIEVSPLKEKPNVKWSDIANLSDAKRAIQESIIFPSRRPDLFPLGWPTGVLLFGPPGCGKTLLAAAVAGEIEANFFCVDAASIMSKWLGESEKNVAKMFDEARENSANGKPAIIFIDEVDSLAKVYSNEVGGETRVRNQFLKEMDGISDKKKNSHIYVIGATNKPWSLDEPFIRRFQKRILISPPDTHARMDMFKIYSNDMPLYDDVNLEELASKTDGYSGSDIKDIFQAVQLKIVREFFDSSKAEDLNAKPRLPKMTDFLETLEKRKASLSDSMMRNYNAWYKQFQAL